ncbi:Crp/Fnr family transcriptional regulator [Aureispira anguillae]|uniref:Crp/Fnr family transcriptional regulator n=1 Tax=Aureispira anguillae TaxID=2864201 RepID=A0A915YIN3_9BACT|nr:Crp/Fnr family transcriptional regulator [Aureispira anguillae]BDS13874.1 Crp/Fnr family transcriptional regulator [Aureispira anguillae]
MSEFIRRTLIRISNDNDFSLTEAELTNLVSFFDLRTIPKGNFWLREGQYCTQIAVVEEGLLMYYKNVEGEEIALDFAMEENWVSYIKSINQKIPSDINIRTLEDCKVHTLSIESMELLFREHPKLIQIKVAQTEQSFMEMAEYNSNLNILTPEEHYRKLTEKRGEWLNRVPQYYIASYLGIKPQSLSRIRSRISREKK